MRILLKKGLSYDDVLLKPQKTSVDSRSEIDISVRLADHEIKTPVMSAAMDTVTEHELASEVARLGGLGCIHRFMTAEDQTQEVRKVKNSGTAKNSATDRDGKLLVSAAVGLNDRKRAKRLIEAGLDFLVLDIAHGHHTSLIREIKYYRERFDAGIIAGNVGTAEGAKDLVDAGADAVKVGIGPGSSCITREVAGAGVPQFTAVKECAEAIDKPVIADGGIRKPGDLSKAIAAGASLGQLGGMFAGTDETPGEIIREDGKKYKLYRGMASKEAAEKRAERENREEKSHSEKAPEGTEVKVEYKGGLKEIISNLEGGLRSGISYCGAESIEQAQRNAEFIEITESTQSRNPHHAESI